MIEHVSCASELTRDRPLTFSVSLNDNVSEESLVRVMQIVTFVSFHRPCEFLLFLSVSAGQSFLVDRNYYFFVHLTNNEQRRGSFLYEYLLDSEY